MSTLSNRKNVPVTASCLQCGYTFHKNTALNDFCSAKCKRERNNQLRVPRVSLKKERTLRTLKSVIKVEKLNKNNPKSEAVLIENMIELNRNAPRHDRETIEKNNIVSPDLSKMGYKVYDKKMRCTYYFKKEEKYLNYLKKQEDEKSN